VHLGLRVHPQPALVTVRVGARIGVGLVAGAFLPAGTGGCEDRLGWVGRFVGAEPSVSPPDVVQMRGAIGVRLRPFAAEGGTEAGG
jgi:hypothetical protein